jgi:hypothetical protein
MLKLTQVVLLMLECAQKKPRQCNIGVAQSPKPHLAEQVGKSPAGTSPASPSHRHYLAAGHFFFTTMKASCNSKIGIFYNFGFIDLSGYSG